MAFDPEVIESDFNLPELTEKELNKLMENHIFYSKKISFICKKYINRRMKWDIQKVQKI